jgi:hypothetical protein
MWFWLDLDMQCKIHAPIEVESTQQSNQGVSGYQGKQRWSCRSPKQEETYIGVDTLRGRVAAKKRSGYTWVRELDLKSKRRFR